MFAGACRCRRTVPAHRRSDRGGIAISNDMLDGILRFFLLDCAGQASVAAAMD